MEGHRVELRIACSSFIKAKEVRLLFSQSEALSMWAHKQKYRIYGPMRVSVCTKVSFSQPHEVIMAECVNMLKRDYVWNSESKESIIIPLSVNLHIDGCGNKNAITCMFFLFFFFFFLFFFF